MGEERRGAEEHAVESFRYLVPVRPDRPRIETTPCIRRIWVCEKGPLPLPESHACSTTASATFYGVEDYLCPDSQGCQHHVHSGGGAPGLGAYVRLSFKGQPVCYGRRCLKCRAVGQKHGGRPSKHSVPLILSLRRCSEKVIKFDDTVGTCDDPTTSRELTQTKIGALIGRSR